MPLTGTPVGFANITEAVAGNIDTKAMSPLQVKNATAAIKELSQNNFIRSAKTMLALSAGTTNLDLFVDLFADDSQINTGASNGYMLSGGKIVRYAQSVATTTGSVNFGTATVEKIGQSFVIPPINTSAIISVSFYLGKGGSPTDSILCRMYNCAEALLFTSDNTFLAEDITGAVYRTFIFSNHNIDAGTYLFMMERTGALDISNCYNTYYCSPSGYAQGLYVTYTGGAFAYDAAKDLSFSLNFGDAVVIWNAKTVSEALANAAICADQTLNTGSITFSVSDDGTNWEEITALDAMQAVTFSETSLYLKAVIAGNAELLGVAWGGY